MGAFWVSGPCRHAVSSSPSALAFWYSFARMSASIRITMRSPLVSIVLMALGEQLVMLAYQFEGAQLQRLMAVGLVAGAGGDALKRLLRSHYRALCDPFTKIGDVGGELYIFLQSGESALGRMARRFGVGLLVRAPIRSTCMTRVNHADSAKSS
jgi:hypothetical protein